jgi:hypothetical protein
MLEFKVTYRHPILRSHAFVLVENMKDWADGSVTSDIYWQRVKEAHSPLTYFVIETAGAITEHGECGYDVIGATLALAGGNEKWPVNPTLAIDWAIRTAISEGERGPFRILRGIYEATIGECPFEIEENSSSDWKTPYQLDLPGDKARPDEWKKLKSLMDTDIDSDEDEDDEKSSGSSGMAGNGVNHAGVTTEASKETDKRNKRKNLRTQDRKTAGETKTNGAGGSPNQDLTNQGYKVIPSSGGLWSKTGRKPAQKRIVNGQIKTVSAGGETPTVVSIVDKKDS